MHPDDYLEVLQAVDTLDFGVGQDLLAAFLTGNPHDSIERNGLHDHPCHGALAYSTSEALGLIEQCRNHDLIEYQQLPHKPNIYVLTLTSEGEDELDEPSNPINVPNIPYTNTEPTSETKELIDEFSFFLDGYNDAQQRSIVTPDDTVLCVAGAGTGKTTVLTKRIEYLVKYTDADPDSILAITFTRKAKSEMEHRLRQNDVAGVNVHTFNGYAEQLIQRYTDDTIPPLAEYADTVRLLNQSLDDIGHSPDTAIDTYFSASQRRGSSKNDLLNNLRRDTIRLVTQSKLNQSTIDSLDADTTEAQLIKRLADAFHDRLNGEGYRLHADQLTGAAAVLKAKPQHYDHVLVDEYQDVNDAQVRMLDAIEKESLFCVGDPRQSIYGWRGSRIEHTTKFTDEHPDATIITLTKNYRSAKDILSVANQTIRPMLLPPVEPTRDDGIVQTHKYQTEDEERSNVKQVIDDRDHPILVLARRNQQLRDLSSYLDKHGVPHSLKEDADDAVTNTTILATIHAVKGLEAPTVIIIGANATNHPLRVSDHPMLEQLQPDSYDRDEEERRLFYVAQTRAEDELIITWTSRKTTYLNTPRNDTDNEGSDNRTTKTAGAALREWRKEQSQAARIPEFKILPNSTLRKILSEQPRSEHELSDIWGITPERLEKYGDDILELLARHG